jgi:hypothetical protein
MCKPDATALREALRVSSRSKITENGFVCTRLKHLFMHPLRQLDRSYWPTLIHQIAEIIGNESALDMFIRFGGQRLTIPRNRSPEHPVDGLIGSEKAERLSKIFGREELLFPNGRLLLINLRNKQIVEAWLNGTKQADLAAAFNLTQRQINTIVNSHKDIQHKIKKINAGSGVICCSR